MAGHLVALRLALLGASLTTPRRKVGALLAAFLSGVLATVATLAAAVSGAAPGEASAIVIASGLWGAWVVVPLLGPLLGAGLDDSLRPACLRLLPLRGRELVPGLLAAGAIGPAGWATALVAIGLCASHVRTVDGGFVATLAVALLVVLTVASGRAALTVMSRRSNSRRRRDAVLAAALVVLVAAGSAVAPLLLSDGTSLEDVADVLQWGPAGQIGLSLQNLRSGDSLAALAHLGAVCGFAAVLLAVWARSLDRALVTADDDGARASTRSPLDGVARWLPVSDPRTAAVAAKEIVLTFRDPIRRSTWLVAWTVGVGSPAYFGIAGPGGAGPELTLLTALPVFLAAGGVNLNSFGLDGPAVWTQISSSPLLGPDLRGRTLALICVNAPCMVVTAVGLAALGGDLAWAPVGLAAGAGVLLAVLGTGAVLSVRVPLPRARDALGVSPGTSSRNVLLSASAVVASLLCLAPGVGTLVLGFTVWEPGIALGAVLLVACGAVVCGGCLRSATRWVDARLPEMLTLVTKEA